jgi:hypothetical protein
VSSCIRPHGFGLDIVATTISNFELCAVPVQRLRHPIQEGGAARRGDGERRRVPLRVRGSGRQGVPVLRRRRRGRQRAVPRVAAQRRRAGPGVRRRLAGTDQLVPAQLVVGSCICICGQAEPLKMEEGATFFVILGMVGWLVAPDQKLLCIMYFVSSQKLADQINLWCWQIKYDGRRAVELICMSLYG